MKLQTWLGVISGFCATSGVVCEPGPSLFAATRSCPGNTAEDRTRWGDFTIHDDFHLEVPDTGVTREYFFEVQHGIGAPDGYTRPVVTINGSIPGPTIIADWGDNVVVHVTNRLDSIANGTSLHFHGIQQNFTNPMDGTSSITQCPIAPGHRMSYRWRATQYGTAWYHSHFGLQAWEGLAGGIIINGPATANYEEDKGVIFVSDWSHQTSAERAHIAETDSTPRMDTGLINGTNIYNQTGARFTMAFTPGRSYRLRFINSAVSTTFKVMIDHHVITVIAADLVPIVPYKTTALSIAPGQRYDVVVPADQSTVADAFWLRAIPQETCSKPDNPDGIRGIVHYSPIYSEPNTTGYEYTDSCDDEDMRHLIPFVPRPVGSHFWTVKETVGLLYNEENLIRWYMNNSVMHVDWQSPTLMQTISAGSDSFPRSSAVIDLPKANKWVFLVIETQFDASHPLHLHGHDFAILAQGRGHYDPSTVVFSPNPPWRDTAMLPALGHLVIAFLTDNPGAWLLHCHMGWHSSEGFALQFLERGDELRSLIDADFLLSNCANWNEYYSSDSRAQVDSGI